MTAYQKRQWRHSSKFAKCRPDSTVPVPFHCVDVYVKLPTDTHMDATSVQFVQHSMEDGRCPDWGVSSPQYRDALLFLTNACHISKFGVAFKLQINFLEPVPSRAEWLMKNLPWKGVVLSRATSRGTASAAVEACFVRKVGSETVSASSFFFAPTG